MTVPGKYAVKTENMRSVTETLFERHPVSRAEIAGCTGLSLMTVGKVIDSLASAGVVVQAKEVKREAGRKAGLVLLKPELHYVVIALAEAPTAYIFDPVLKLNDIFTHPGVPGASYDERLFYFCRELGAFLQKKYSFEDCAGICAVNQNPDGLGAYTPQKLRELISGALLTEVAGVYERTAAALRNAVRLYGGKTIYVFSGGIISGKAKKIECTYSYDGRCCRKIDIGKLIFGLDTRGLASFGDCIEEITGPKLKPERCAGLLASTIYDIGLITGCDTIMIELPRGADFSLFEKIYESLPEFGAMPKIVFYSEEIGCAYFGAACILRELWLDKILSSTEHL